MSFNEGSDYTRLRSGMVSNEGMDSGDPNMMLLTDYLSGEMLESDRAAFEDRLENDAAFFNDVMPMIELVEALRVAKKQPEHRVEDHTSARIAVERACSVLVGMGATATIVTPLGEVVVKQGAYAVECVGGPEAGEVRVRRMTPA